MNPNASEPVDPDPVERAIRRTGVSALHGYADALGAGLNVEVLVGDETLGRTAVSVTCTIIPCAEPSLSRAAMRAPRGRPCRLELSG